MGPATWTVRDVDARLVGDLSTALGVLPVTARCLAVRGGDTPERARAFLGPRLAALRPPVGLPDLEVAVDRLARAVRAGERIGCFGDYDVDGITTTALLATYLRDLGAACVPRVARRFAGYGFGVDDAAFFADAGCGLIITGDCGTSDHDAILAAAGRGLEVVVIDHHTVPDGGAHPALALVNPRRLDATFPFAGMASVGLAFYLVAALRTRLREGGFFATRPEPPLRDLLDLVAIGTVADLVPLEGENRILTAVGLREASRRLRPGVAALLAQAGVEPGRSIDERDIGWRLAPRINAPGRMGDATPALELLLAREPTEAARCAGILEEANQRRRAAQDEVWLQALAAAGAAEADGEALVVAGEGWPPGVVGIIAAKLVERFARPAFVIAVDPATGEGRGSARAVAGVDVYRALAASAPALVRYGGHAAAAGLTVERGQIGALRAALSAAVGEQRRQGAAGPARTADAEVALGDVDARLAGELAHLAPFGKGNDEPLLLCRRLTVTESRRVGDGSHLKMSLGDGSGRAPRDAIGFGLGERDPGAGATVDILFAPQLSEWQGRQRVELSIRDLAPAAAG